MSAINPEYRCPNCSAFMFKCQKCTRVLHDNVQVMTQDAYFICTDCAGTTLKANTECPRLTAIA